MGLFGRKKKEEKPERITFESPHGTFYYIAHPAVNEFGYEGYIDWKASGRTDPSIPVYIDMDSSETTQAGLCYARLEELFADQDRVEDEITQIIADHFMRMPDMIADGNNLQMLMDNMELYWLGVFRNGDTQYSYDAYGIYASDISLTIHADGSKEIEYMYDYEKHTDKL